MWINWFPWKFIVRYGARAQGFLDPIQILSQLQRFGQPAEVVAPTELLRAGAVLQARGLMNSQAIQHNLDWIWPYWVQKQFDPKDPAFVPRAFNLTHINLTHRNWTAIGLPDVSELPIVDPRGLLTPFLDGWSLDAWVLDENGSALLPSRAPDCKQELDFSEGWAVRTRSHSDLMSLESTADMTEENGVPVCRLKLKAFSHDAGWVAISVRPCNPEGVSFVDTIERIPDMAGWLVNDRYHVEFEEEPERQFFSTYHEGDAYQAIFKTQKKSSTSARCKVGMATAAALFGLEAGEEKTIILRIPLVDFKSKKKQTYKPVSWPESLKEASCQLRCGHERFQYLYDAAVRSLVLHSPHEVYPGPYTYKRFWFRDAAFILEAMLAIGLSRRTERTLDLFPSKQTSRGYFLSQEGEWDSNGEALWILKRFCELTRRAPKPEWKRAILKAGHWIQEKRLRDDLQANHAGLLPAGFSAEHLGPNDFYYWDDFWGVAGLRSAAWLAAEYGEERESKEFSHEAELFNHALQRSLTESEEAMGEPLIPASPYRRMDAGAIGSMAYGYPLQLCKPNDKAMVNTADFLVKTSFVDGGFFQEISHSGINQYLTLHVAQVFLRAGDPRFIELMEAMGRMASPTGQWPEAIHPATGGGCMGDGQHIWAAAEWILMVRNCFVTEEFLPEPKLVLGRGLTEAWFREQREISFGPTPTVFGPVTIHARHSEKGVELSWSGQWFDGKEPLIEVQLPAQVAV